jgi:hypothetical protein
MERTAVRKFGKRAWWTDDRTTNIPGYGLCAYVWPEGFIFEARWVPVAQIEPPE